MVFRLVCLSELSLKLRNKLNLLKKVLILLIIIRIDSGAKRPLEYALTEWYVTKRNLSFDEYK